MRFPERGFSIPFTIFAEPMPDKAFRLLCFLFSVSDFRGTCRPGYALMKRGADIGSDATVKSSLDYLRGAGWIIFTKKGGSHNTTIGLSIPGRLRSKDVPMAVYRGRASVRDGHTVLHPVKNKRKSSSSPNGETNGYF